MAPHSSTLAWKIPWTAGPGGLQSMGSLEVRHDWATSLWLFTFMATHSSVLAWRIPGMGKPGGLPSMGHTELDTTERLHFHFSLSCIGEGNGNPLQCSCLENPRDGGASWAAVYGVAQSWTRLKRLSSSSFYSHKKEKIPRALVAVWKSQHLLAASNRSSRCDSLRDSGEGPLSGQAQQHAPLSARWVFMLVINC